MSQCIDMMPVLGWVWSGIPCLVGCRCICIL